MDRSDYRIEIAQLPPDEGGGWFATVPELPGCMSDGRSRDEALHNVRSAILEWIAEAKALGREVPAPSKARARGVA